MADYINLIIKHLKNKRNIALICAIIFIFGVILGAILSLSESFLCFYRDFLLSYFDRIFSRETFGVSYLFKRLILCLVLFLIIGLSSLNKYTFYLTFLILFYRGYVLGLAFKLFIGELLINGIFFFLFLVLVNALFTALAITLFICLYYTKTSTNNINCILKHLLLCSIIAIFGLIIEFIFIVAIFRPFNFYF